MIYKHITELIGNTPLLLVPETVHKIPYLILYAKLEYQNPFWSLKDRFAWYGIRDYVESLKNNPHAKILESSSGNTIKAIAGIANTFGISSKTITNRIKIQEQKDMLMLMGVDVEQLPSDGECIDLTQKNNAVELIEQECNQNKNYIHTDQYRNKLNTQAHIDTTWPEIFSDLPDISYFFWSLGTTWSSWWVTKFLKSKRKDLTSIGVVSDMEDFIPGIRNIKEMNEVGIFEKSLYDDIYEVNSIQAIHSSIDLIKKVGIMCWPTTGAVYRGLLHYFQKNPILDWKPKTWVFIVCDRIEPYMSYIKQRIPKIFHQEHNLCFWEINPQDQEKYAKSISPQELYEILQNNPEKLLMFDTRSNKSFTLWHIPWSINIELDLLTELTDKWKIFDKNKKVILLCPLGKQTKKLCSYLNMWWFDCYSLEWGLTAWKKK